MVKKYEIGHEFNAVDGTTAVLMEILPNTQWKLLFSNGSEVVTWPSNVCKGGFKSHGVVIEQGDFLAVPVSDSKDFVYIDKCFSHLIPKGKRFKAEEQRGYRRVRLSSKDHRGEHLSRAIAKEVLGKEFGREVQVDHIDRNPLNNLLCNLRFATNRMNTNNRGEANYLRENLLVSGGASYYLCATIDAQCGKQYRVTTPSIRNKEVILWAYGWFSSLLRQKVYTEKVDCDLEQSRQFFSELFDIAAEESKTRRWQDRSYSYEEWIIKYGPALDIARECEEFDRKFIKEFSGHPYGATLKDILNG